MDDHLARTGVVVCAHGSLERACPICERDAELAHLRALLAVKNADTQNALVQRNAAEQRIAALERELASAQSEQNWLRAQRNTAEAKQREAEDLMRGWRDKWLNDKGIRDALIAAKGAALDEAQEFIVHTSSACSNSNDVCVCGAKEFTARLRAAREAK